MAKYFAEARRLFKLYADLYILLKHAIWNGSKFFFFDFFFESYNLYLIYNKDFQLQIKKVKPAQTSRLLVIW